MATHSWRGNFTNEEINSLQAKAFGTGSSPADEWDWQKLVAQHSLGWVVAFEPDLEMLYIEACGDSPRPRLA